MKTGICRRPCVGTSHHRRLPEQISGGDVSRRMAAAPVAMIGGGGEIAARARRSQVVKPGQLLKTEVPRHVDQSASRRQGVSVEPRAQATQSRQERPFEAGGGELGRETGRQDEIRRAQVRRRPMSKRLRAHLPERHTNLGACRAPARRSVLPGKGQGRADAGQRMSDPRADVAATVDIHLAAMAFPPDRLGAKGQSVNRCSATIREKAAAGCRGHAPVSDGRRSGCVRTEPSGRCR